MAGDVHAHNGAALPSLAGHQRDRARPARRSVRHDDPPLDDDGGGVSGEPGTDVSDVTVDEGLVRRAAIAPGGIVAVDRDGRLIENWLPGYRTVDGPPRFVSVR